MNILCETKCGLFTDDGYDPLSIGLDLNEGLPLVTGWRSGVISN
jgi:hypothetical protein